MIRYAYAAASILLVATGLHAQQASSFKFLSPREGSFASDRIRLAVEIPPAEIDQVKALTFFADGRQVCVIVDVRRPSCEWDAGPTVRPHQFRAVATLASGERRVTTVRTKGLDVTEFSSVEVVQVTAVVTDNGRFVKGLLPKNFRIFEDGVPQPIQFLGAEDMPLEAVIALDVSGSMSELMPELKAGVRLFIRALRPQDHASVLAFNDSVYTVANRDLSPAERETAIERLFAWGNTSLYDAVREGIARLARGQGRRALVVFTDGADSASSSTLDEVEAVIGASDVTVYVIGLARGPKRNELRKVMERMAEPSGGRVLYVDEPRDLQQQFGEAVRDLANQYLLGYQPRTRGKPGEWRSVKVEVVDVRGRVRARQGYRVGGGR